MLAFYGIIAGVNRTNVVLDRNGFASFIYFTMPRWIALMHYSATISVTVMFFCFVYFFTYYKHYKISIFAKFLLILTIALGT